MHLFNGLLRRRQAQVAPPPIIKDLEPEGYIRPLADCVNTMLLLDFRPDALDAPAVVADSAPKRNSRAAQSDSCYQFNIRLSGKLRQALKAVARRRRISMNAAANEALAEWVARHTQ